MRRIKFKDLDMRKLQVVTEGVETEMYIPRSIGRTFLHDHKFVILMCVGIDGSLEEIKVTRSEFDAGNWVELWSSKGTVKQLKRFFK